MTIHFKTSLVRNSEIHRPASDSEVHWKLPSIICQISDFTADVFWSEKELFSWTYLLRKTPRRTKILIPPLWRHTSWAHKTKFFYNKKLKKLFFKTKSFWKWHRKVTVKLHSKLKNMLYYIFTENICSSCNTIQVIVFCKHVLILQKNDSIFLTLKIA